MLTPALRAFTSSEVDREVRAAARRSVLTVFAVATIFATACPPSQAIVKPESMPGAMSLELPGTNSALGCVSSAWHKPQEHGEYFEAWKHVKASAGITKEFTLAGHGDRGLLCAGLEDACWNDFSNGSIFTIDLEALKKFEGDVTASRGNLSTLRLVGCKVGAGADGAALVQAISRLLNAEVSAPTCDVECADGVLSMAEGCAWYTAGPTLSPTPIDVAPVTIPPYSQAQFSLSGQIVTVDVRKVSVSEIEITMRSKRGFRAITPTPSQGQTVLAGIELSHPRKIKGSYLARRTARLTLTFPSVAEKGGPRLRTKHLVILNWEHAVDEDNPSVVYDVDRRLKAVVEAF